MLNMRILKKRNERPNMVCVFLCVNMEKPKRQPMTKHEGKKICFFSSNDGNKQLRMGKKKYEEKRKICTK